MDNINWAGDNSGNALKDFLNLIGTIPLLTPEEELELGERIKKGDRSAIERMVEGNLRLVVKIAKGYMGVGIPLIDLIQEGAIGLQFAAERFDVDLGFRFSTYAGYWIKQQITKAITDNSRSIRIPSNVINEMAQLNKLKKEFIDQYDREPTFQELCEMTDMDPDKLLDVLDVQQGAVSLDRTLPDGEDNTVMDLVADNKIIDPAEYSSQQARKEAILDVLNSLDTREKDILVKRFGLDDGMQKTLDQVGDMVGLTRERVRQIEIGALKKLRNPLRSAPLLDYV